LAISGDVRQFKIISASEVSISLKVNIFLIRVQDRL